LEVAVLRDKTNKTQRIVRWLVAGLPLSGVIAASFFPLRIVFQQALIGFVLIWLQFSLMLGLFE
jgi:hypothetical protein